ncbi:TetR/AcrR family transcriptional regulator [Tepidicaulis sp.]|uniref:TetR/AcrR family transcriptional regulator n=1 Tax=Tepidicaulis sp. TaxID=1920809 RepID=UPI003B5C8B05
METVLFTLFIRRLAASGPYPMTRASDLPAASRRDHLIQTAGRLFARDGFHATGIDKIILEAGVSKKTLYSHFRSKEELILAVLRVHDSAFRNNFMRDVEKNGRDARSRLAGLFDAAENWFEEPGFYGCIFINAVGEYAQASPPIRSACQDFKNMMRAFILKLCREAGASEPEALADELALLFEGATVTAQVSGSSHAARTAKRAALALIGEHFSQA